MFMWKKLLHLNTSAPITDSNWWCAWKRTNRAETCGQTNF